jgi:hypothetical protein
VRIGEINQHFLDLNERKTVTTKTSPSAARMNRVISYYCIFTELKNVIIYTIINMCVCTYVQSMSVMYVVERKAFVNILLDSQPRIDF